MRATIRGWSTCLLAAAIPLGLASPALAAAPPPPPPPPAGGPQAVVPSTPTHSLPHTPYVTMDLHGTDVRTVLRYLARRANLSLVIDESVTGTLTLDIHNLPFDEAFSVVLKAKDLGYQRVGGAILVASNPVLEKKHLNDNTATIRLNNALADTLVGKIQPMVPPGSVIISDPRSNSIAIKGPDEAIALIRSIIASLDNPLPQVLIEVKMLEMNEADGNSLRVGIGQSNYKGASGPAPQLVGIGPQTGNGNTGVPGGVGGSFTPDDAGTVFQWNPYAPNTYSNFNLQLSWLLTHGRATILANPRVLAQDSQQATINLVNQVPYVTFQVSATGQQLPQVNFVNIGQSLAITPRIDDQGYITMILAPNITTSGGAPVTVGGSSIPVVNQRAVSTTMRVRDGQSIVIGGLLREDKSTNISKIPLLGDIPLLGYLFRQTNETTSRNEIMVVVTPHVVRQDTGSAHTPIDAPDAPAAPRL